MDINAFLHNRQGRWQRLETLLERLAADRELQPAEVEEFFRLYRLASSDLNWMQSRQGNATVLEYLEALVGRAYAQIHVPRRANPLRRAWHILRWEFPAAVRAELGLLLLSTLLTLAGIILGFAATAMRPENADYFLPAEHLSLTPRQRVEHLEAQERRGHTPVAAIDEHAHFAIYLFTHNIRVSVLAFALGLTFGLGTAVLLFYNGALLGSLAALYWSNGVGLFFVAWVSPHGSLEIPCILLAGTAGFMLARCQLRRDEGSLAHQIRAIRPRLAQILLGSATLLVLAGIVEGRFSQINEPTLPYVLKILVAGILFSLLVGYLFFLPVDETTPTAGP